MMDTHSKQQNSRDPKAVKEQLEHGAFGPLLQKARHLLALNQLFQQTLEPEARPHCRLMNQEGGLLLIEVDNASWATQLRYQSQTLLNQLRQQVEFSELTHIQFKVYTPASTAAPAPVSNPPSAENRKMIEAIALGIQDEKLRDALLRLARKA